MVNGEELVRFAHTLADGAGAIIRPYFGKDAQAELKADETPVSRADREAEAAMRTLIKNHYPEHGIHGEEHGQQGVDKKYVWAIDPIDGTRAFLAGKKEWGTLIALCEDGLPILGILDQPVTGERWVGVKSEATTYAVIASDSDPERSGERRSQPIHLKKKDGLPRRSSALRNDANIETRPCASLTQASISTTSRNYFTPPQAKAFVALAEQCREVIEDGDCYAYGLLARGDRDLVIDAGLKPYDILALIPIIEGAGGKLTAWDGSAITLNNFSSALAAGNAEIYEVARAVLK